MFCFQVIKNQEFLELNESQLINLLSNDDLNVSSEEDIFNALMSWVNHDLPNRKQYIGNLISYVKLPLLEPSFLIDQVENVIENDSESMKLVLQAFKWHLLPERRVQMMSWLSRPRKSTLGKLLVVGGMDKNKGSTVIESYDPRNDTWSVAYHMNGRRLQFGIALNGSK